MVIHNATLELDGERFTFSSLDGERWLPVNRRGWAPGDAETLAALFEGDGNLRPMAFSTAYLAAQGATFEEAPAVGASEAAS
jgi:hypothetical protein